MRSTLWGNSRSATCVWLVLGLVFVSPFAARTAHAQPSQTRGEIYGFVMGDAGYQFGQNNPLYFDVVRPTKLPAFEDEFGGDGRTFWSVRQTRFGIRTFTPTRYGELRILFEWNLVGSGDDVGQTTFRLRHAWGELGDFGMGQTWSVFMDSDVFPKIIEYWGPSGLAWFRNVQIRWMPIHKKDGDRFAISLERPGASADAGVLDDRIELDSVRGRFPLPDLAAEYREAGSWGHVELAGVIRYIAWDDLFDDDEFDLDGSEWGWGLNLTSNIKVGPERKNTIRLGVLYGEGVQNYLNDAPVDVGVRSNFDDEFTPITGEALPVLGLTAYYDHTWSGKYTSAIGWSMIDIDNSDLQSIDAFRRGHYASVNLLYYPVDNLMVGGEFQFARRENFLDDWTYNDFRIQVSAKYSFAIGIGG